MMFDYLGRPAFAAMTALLVLDVVWIVMAGHTLAWGVLGSQLLITAALVFATYALRAAPPRFAPKSEEFCGRLSRFCEALIFMQLGWIALRLFNHLGMTLPFPYADDLLAGWDAALFGDAWQSYFAWVAASPFRIEWLERAYWGLTPVATFGFLGLFVLEEEERGRRFIWTFAVTGFVCTTIGMFFPARAAVATILTAPELLNAFSSKPGWYSVDIIENLRTAASSHFDVRVLPGLTTFPSFHTAGGVVLFMAYRGTWLAWPVGLYAAVMIASTPVFGGHYLIDIIAGAVLAYAVCAVFERQSDSSTRMRGSDWKAPKSLAGGKV